MVAGIMCDVKPYPRLDIGKSLVVWPSGLRRRIKDLDLAVRDPG